MRFLFLLMLYGINMLIAAICGIGMSRPITWWYTSPTIYFWITIFFIIIFFRNPKDKDHVSFTQQ